MPFFKTKATPSQVTGLLFRKDKECRKDLLQIDLSNPKAAIRWI